jgi:hypothetical protein
LAATQMQVTKTMPRIILLSILVATAQIGTALACAPAPSCWLKSGPDYLRSICSNYAKDHQTQKQIAQ